MNNDLKKVLAIAAGVVVAGSGVLLVARNFGSEAAPPNDQDLASGQSPVSTTTGATTTTVTEAPSPTEVVPQDTIVENLDAAEFDPYPTGDERENIEDTVRSWGCGWWARPVAGETIEEVAERLGPLTGQTLYDSILELNEPADTSGTTLEVVPGEVELLGEVDTPIGRAVWYRVSCNAVELDSEGRPVGATSVKETDVWIKVQPEGSVVVQAKIGGLTIP